MAKVIITRGLPGSGKSTWAKEEIRKNPGKVIGITRDMLRIMLHDDIFQDGTEEVTVAARNALIEKFLKMGKDVIVHDTNLPARTVKEIARLATKHGAAVEIKDFDVDVEECIRRDALRTATVGPDVIRSMHQKFFHGGFPKNPLENTVEEFKPVPYVPDLNLPRAIIVDVDGTVADHCDNRSPYDYTKVSGDAPRHAVIEAVRMYEECGYDIIFLSGRKAICGEDTRSWLKKHVNVPFELFMRATNDERPDWLIKYEIFDREIRNKYNIAVVFDDRKQVLDMWQSLGLVTFNVSHGDNDF